MRNCRKINVYALLKQQDDIYGSDLQKKKNFIANNLTSLYSILNYTQNRIACRWAIYGQITTVYLSKSTPSHFLTFNTALDGCLPWFLWRYEIVILVHFTFSSFEKTKFVYKIINRKDFMNGNT